MFRREGLMYQATFKKHEFPKGDELQEIVDNDLYEPETKYENLARHCWYYKGMQEAIERLERMLETRDHAEDYTWEMVENLDQIRKDWHEYSKQFLPF